ncbi:hypothetical protein [uncultured Kordia sp.]|uniref:hypothetical protein n=1 Tax=uncultured Kordia sp. TaxID=507699 RepID=UPI00263221F0|nr:hypothetical protein [uncultured Kordia sp.]
MLFTKKNIATSLSKEETLNQIKTITKPISLNNVFDVNSDENYEFEGHFDNFSFTLFPLFNYGLNQLLRPKIIGQIETSNDQTVIKLEFYLPKMITYVLLLLLVIAILILNTASIDFNTFMIYGLITMLGFYFGFLYRINKAINIIKARLN